MSTELTLVTDEEIAALAGEMGASVEDLLGGGGYTPSLKVNYEEDSDEEDAPRLKGKLFITGMDVPVYAKPGTIRFRPLTQTFQWTKYDEVTEKVTNRTRLIYTFKEEARDELGTLKCGKPGSKDLKANPALAKQFEDVTCYRTVQGYASYVGITAEGEEVEVPETLVSLRLKGANFAPFDEEYVRKMPPKSMLWDYALNLSVSREKNGASTFFVIHFEPDFTTKLPFTIDVMTDIKELKRKIDEFNRDIDRKYYSALEGNTTDEAAEAAIKTVVSGRPKKGGASLEADFNDDDIPF